MDSDAYSKLRAFSPPAEDLCSCVEPRTLQLMHAFTANPIHCVECNREVPPNRIDLEPDLVEPISRWNRVYGAFYELWIDSGEWEELAAQHLRDPSGRLVTEGLAIVQRLSENRPIYYSWFAEEGVTHSGCPRCGGELDPVETRVGTRRKCERCRILLFADW